MHSRPLRQRAAALHIGLALACILLASGACAQVSRDPADARTRPAAIHTDRVEPIPADLWRTLERYQEIRSARFLDWDPTSKGILISKRLDNLYQLHYVASPGATPQPLTDGDEPISSGRYLPDGRILFSKSVGGNEKYQIHLLDPDLPGDRPDRQRRLTDGESRNLLDEPHPDGRRIAYSSTRRNGREEDLYLQAVDGDEPARLILEVERETWELSDWSPRGHRNEALVRRYISRNESYVRLLDVETGKTRDLPSEANSGGVMGAEKVYRSSFFFGPDGRNVYFLSDARGEFRQLTRMNLKTGDVHWISEGIQWDVSDFEVSADRRRAVFTVNADGYSQLYLLDDLGGARPGYRQLQLPPCLISNLGFSPDGKRLGLTLGSATGASEAHSLNLESGELRRWTTSERAGFKESDFVAPTIIRYPTFDGRKIPAFLFVPRKTTEKIPVVITIHGGPESQFRPWFSPTRQYYVRDLGAAVIAPNVRGSTGYGKSYSLLDNGTKREDSVRDIGALLDWIAGEGAREFRLDPSRVAVTGGSYGGYMVLASLIHFGDRIRAGVDLVGISDFYTFLKNTSGYRRDLRRAEYGDEREAEMKTFFEKISPARQIAQLKSALFVIHGKNDPRVPYSEALQIVDRARSTGQSVWTLYADNEGHGFRRKENNDFTQAATVVFLGEFLLKSR